MTGWASQHRLFLRVCHRGPLLRIGVTLAERRAQTDEAIAEIIAHLKCARPNCDLGLFRDKLIQEWTFYKRNLPLISVPTTTMEEPGSER